MLRWFIADLKTGRQILDVSVLSGRVERFLNAPETLECTLDLQDPDTINLYPRVAASTGRTVLAVAQDDVILGAGPIWAHSYDRSNATLQLKAKGLWSYYDHRFVLPVAAASIPVAQFIIPDESAAGKTKPNPAVGTYISGLEYGTIAKRVVQQVHSWPGGSVPVVFEADRVAPADDAHERNWEGADFKNAGEILSQLSQIEGGPDIIFQPRLTADRLGIEWVLITGTDAVPILSGAAIHRWDVTVPESSVSNFRVDVDGSELAGLAWATGGRSADTVLVARSADSTLIDLGYPLFETLDSSHSSVSQQDTLDRYALEATTFGDSPLEQWSFTVEAEQQPYLGAFWEGDFCDVDLSSYGAIVDSHDLLPEVGDGYYDPSSLTEVSPGYYAPGTLVEDPAHPGFYLVTSETIGDLTGDPYIREGGTFRRRIVGIAFDQDGLTVDITVAPARS